MSRRRDYALLLIAFVASRVALYAAGLRFNLDLRWMFLSDTEALHHRLLETLYYFHAFAPGMNLITGVLSKLGPGHLPALAAALFWAFGALLTLSLARILEALGYARWPAMALAFAFSLLPQTLYLENLYLYTYLCACLLCASAVAFHRALLRGSAWAWFWFFLPCAVLGWLYTVFHLVWFLLMTLLALALHVHAARGARRRAARTVLLGAALPGLLLLAVYAKNYALFGVFGATSWGPSNLTLATTQQMRPRHRQQWIREGKLSPFAAISVYSPPSAYTRLLPKRVYPWPGSNDLVRPTNGVANYNHGLFLEVNAARAKDVTYYLKTRPLDYLRRVFSQNLPSLFHSTTHWHPADRRPEGSHYQHRVVLGGYERLYDRLVHTWPMPGVGLYVFLPPFLAWAAWAAAARLRARDPGTVAAGALLGFCLLQALFVMSTSVLFTAWETSRYRYSVEPCLWVIVALALRAALRGIRARLSQRRAAPPTIDAAPGN